MSDDVPFSGNQNPGPNPPTGQEYLDRRSTLVQEIMTTFRAVLPSNYVAQENGPWYSLQFQGMAEQLADIQITTTQVFKDSAWDFTRPDFLWQVLGTLVFPGGEFPEIDGDTAYRSFQNRMVLLLLSGATKSAIEGGIEALDPSVTAEVIERFLSAPPRDPNGAWTIDNQFEIEVFLSSGDTFPTDPIRLARNVELVLAALKPAHVIYSHSFLFRDAFEGMFDDGDPSIEMDAYHYDDTRRWCLGAERISGSGDTLTSRNLFSDSSLSFSSVRDGAILRIASGANQGAYRVTDVLALPYGVDPVPRAYTTAPTGLSGTLKVIASDVVSDDLQDWSAAADGERITVASGPNAGTYRLDTLLGAGGGPVGSAPGPATNVRLSPTILKLDRRMSSESASQPYEVEIDRLGKGVPSAVLGEDATIQFLL